MPTKVGLMMTSLDQRIRVRAKIIPSLRRYNLRSDPYPAFFGIDLKPVLPVCLAVSTVIGGLCMLLVQIPMLSRFTTNLSLVWLSAPFVVVYGIVLGCMA